MPVTEALKRAVLKQTSEDVLITLLTFSGTGFTTFRVCNNDTDIVSNGNTFVAFPFTLKEPGDGENAPAAELQIANVDRQIGQAIDAASGAVNVLIELVLASAPDDVQKSFDGLELRSTSRSMLIVQGTLQSAQFTSEPYPKIRATPGRLRGLFP